jgi:hypothetical protein
LVLLSGAARAAPIADAGGLGEVCFLTPQSIERPFYLEPRLVRPQIAEARAAVPLGADLRVIDGATCRPSEPDAARLQPDVPAGGSATPALA